MAKVSDPGVRTGAERVRVQASGRALGVSGALSVPSAGWLENGRRIACHRRAAVESDEA
jgi:hypothetical protein